MSDIPSREAFDLHSPACRDNFWHRLPQKWNSLYWWKLVIADTKAKVCSRVWKNEDERALRNEKISRKG